MRPREINAVSAAPPVWRALTRHRGSDRQQGSECGARAARVGDLNEAAAGAQAWVRLLPRLFAAAVWGLLWTAPVTAQEIEGVNVPEEVMLGDTPLVLNGAGVRAKLFVKAYVGALYLPAPTRTPEEVIGSSGPKSVRLVLLRDVEATSMLDELLARFRANSSEEAYGQLRGRIDQFNGALPNLRTGDVVRLDLSDSGRTDFWVNDALIASFIGDDFQAAVLRLWLGDHPADEKLKQALLGLS